MSLRDRWRAGRRSQGRDEGFTLLELVAALTVLATGIFGLIGVTQSSIAVAATTSARSKAVALATQKIEQFRAYPYDSLPVAMYQPATVTASGRTFTIESGVVWRKSVQGALVDAYKSAYVVVSWWDPMPHEVRQETIIYPGGRGPHVPVTTTTVAAPSGTPNPPWNLTAVAVPFSGVVGVDLAWSVPVMSDPPVVSYVVQYSTDNFATAPREITTTNPTPYLRVTDLAAGTTYQFRVYSVAASGTRSNTSSDVEELTTSDGFLTPCRIGVVSIAPAAAYKAGGAQGSKLKTGNPTVTVNTVGNCLLTSLTAWYSPNLSTNLSASLSRSGNVYTGLLDGNQAWDVGRHEIIIVDGNGDERGSAFLLVCEPSKKVCRG